MGRLLVSLIAISRCERAISAADLSTSFALLSFYLHTFLSLSFFFYLDFSVVLFFLGLFLCFDQDSFFFYTLHVCRFYRMYILLCPLRIGNFKINYCMLSRKKCIFLTLKNINRRKFKNLTFHNL